MKRFLLGLLAISIVLYWVTGAQADTVTFDFSSGPGDSFTIVNTGDLWDIELDGPELRISKGPDDGSVNTTGFILGGIRSKFLLEGDFTVTVDFTLYTFPAGDVSGQLNESILAVVTEANHLFEVLRYRSGNRDRREAFVIPPGDNFGDYASTLYTGRYRLMRTGTTMTAQIAAASSAAFTTILTWAGFSDSPVSVWLEAAQGSGKTSLLRSTTAMDISFDNLHIVADSIEPPFPITVPVDIKPRTCPNPINTKSKGVLPVAILGTEDFDVNDIDVSTILLEGVASIRENFEDVATPFNGESLDDCLDCTQDGPDGFPDLKLKFDMQDVVAVLGPVVDGECVSLTLTGSLWDGTPFEGSDFVIIRRPGR